MFVHFTPWRLPILIFNRKGYEQDLRFSLPHLNRDSLINPKFRAAIFNLIMPPFEFSASTN